MKQQNLNNVNKYLMLINWLVFLIILSFFTLMFWSFGYMFGEKVQIAVVGAVLLYYNRFK